MSYKRKCQLFIILAVCVSAFVLRGASAAMQDAPTTKASPSTSSTIQNDQANSPEEAARRLYNAWRTGNRRAALKVADREAVNQLFQERWKDWGPMKPGKTFCKDGVCYYFNKGGGTLEMGVDGGVSVGGYHVTSASLFSAND